LLLIATGYGLYYAGDEQTRPWISCVHWVLGLAAASMAPLHVYLGRCRAEGGKDRGIAKHDPDALAASAGAGVTGQVQRRAKGDAAQRA